MDLHQTEIATQMLGIELESLLEIFSSLLRVVAITEIVGSQRVSGVGVIGIDFQFPSKGICSLLISVKFAMQNAKPVVYFREVRCQGNSLFVFGYRLRTFGAKAISIRKDHMKLRLRRLVVRQLFQNLFALSRFIVQMMSNRQGQAKNLISRQQLHQFFVEEDGLIIFSESKIGDREGGQRPLIALAQISSGAQLLQDLFELLLLQVDHCQVRADIHALRVILERFFQAPNRLGRLLLLIIEDAEGAQRTRDDAPKSLFFCYLGGHGVSLLRQVGLNEPDSPE